MGKWIERPYGFKLNQGKNEDGNETQLIRILPGLHTARGVKDYQVCHHGLVSHLLRGHKGVEWEHVEHRGYVGGRISGVFTLEYIALPFAHDSIDTPLVVSYADGGKFYSVSNDRSKMGFYHKLKNVGSRPIELKITSRPERTRFG